MGSRRKACHLYGALLLPKLRRHFAEFLNHRSPDRLGILYLSTCVGLGYGRCASSLAAFLGSMGSMTSPETARYRVSAFNGARTYLVPRLHAYPRTTIAWAHLPDCVPASLASSGWVGSSEDSPLAIQSRHGRGHSGTGISTGCASTTPVGLALAPDSPWED
jgi:hypothetical protein